MDLRHPTITIEGLEFRWDLERGGFTIAGSRHAIIDVTGVETVDTYTADNFVRLIRGVQLLGANGIISGIGPLVAQTIVDLGVDLTGIPTYANLKEALQACIANKAGRGARRPSP